MKPRASLCLAAVVALASTALGCGGASSLDVAACSAPPEAVDEGTPGALQCKEGTGIASVRLGFAPTRGTEALFATEAGNIRCRKARGEARIEQEGAALEGEVTELAFGECGTNVPSCLAVNELRVEVPIEPVEIRYLGVDAPQARIVLRRPRASVSLRCSLTGEIRCIYGAGEALAGTIGNPPAQELRFDAPLALSDGASLCAKEAFVRMIADVEAEDLVLDDGTRLERGDIWVAKTK